MVHPSIIAIMAIKIGLILLSLILSGISITSAYYAYKLIRYLILTW